MAKRHPAVRWRHDIVIQIRKGLGPTNTMDNFRPFTLTSCVEEVMERLVNRRFVQHLETEDRLDHRQHAITTGHTDHTFLLWAKF